MIEEIYARMCDCPEIQKDWYPKVGDLTDCGIVINVLKSVGKSWSLELIDENPKDCDCPSHALSELRKDAVWLSYQSQIQEKLLNMVDENQKKRFTIPKLFGHFQSFFGSFKNYERFISFEQLWLAFYMHEKHKKIWDGKKWLKK